MAIVPIKKKSVSDEVYQQLKNNLIKGTWKPGDKMPSENELSKLFGVSRVTVRQAMSKLLTLGLIETRLGEGTYVCKIETGEFMSEMIPYVYLNKESTKEVLHFRLLTEPSYAADATEKITKEEIEQLEEIYANMLAVKDNMEEYVRNDVDFHTIIANATRNSLVSHLNSIIQEIIKKNVREASEKLGKENGLKYHGLLIDALKKKDAKAARDIMAQHLLDIKSKIES